MARQQTRRSVSISNHTYLRLKAYCTDNGCSMSGVVETLIKETVPDIEVAATTYLETGKLNGTDDFVTGVALEPEVVELEPRLEAIRQVVESRVPPAPKELGPKDIFTF